MRKLLESFKYRTNHLKSIKKKIVNVWYRQNAMKIVLLVLTMMATTHLRKMYKPYRNRFSDKFKHV